MNKFLYLIALLSCTLGLWAQKGTIKGRVSNAKNNEPLEFATIQIQGTTIGATANLEGVFTITGVTPGFVRLLVNMVGFEPTLSEEIQVQGNQTTFIDIEVPESSTTLREVLVRPNLTIKRAESPLSVQTLGIQQIEKSAGANRDVSKLVQTLPGVGATDPNRNDLIVRGGGPSENVFYLDGIEIPVINHFATQGASGGVVGIINPDFVREISFYTGAFPASRPNALSSVMEIRQRDGSLDRLHTKAAIGASDAGITLEGPLSKQSSFIFSARQSYLQWLFRLIKLPFLPTYNDFQLKYKHKFDAHNELSIVALGAIDRMRLNTDLQSTGTEAQRYILSYLPEYDQWNYTIGAVYKHYHSRFVDSWVLSRNMLRNGSVKYEGNDPSGLKLSQYQSDETENKLRYERTYTTLPIKLSLGAGLKHAYYTNEAYQQTLVGGEIRPSIYETRLSLLAYHAFAQVSDEYLEQRLKLSLGLNLAGNTFNRTMRNPLGQLSPRLSASLALTDDLDLNANIGRYAMQPSYTTMGYKRADGTYANKHDSLRYIISNQAVLGAEYHPGNHLRLSVEAFYKAYSQYPLSISDGISMASKGADYGQVGDEPVRSVGRGRAYGVELVGKFVGWRGLDVTATYTLFKSEFTDRLEQYRPSSWDTRQMLNLLASYKLGRSWYFSARWRYVGGAPYSPIDLERSRDKKSWSVTRRAYVDYSRFNSLRLPDAHQLDVRLDKELYFKHWMLNLYVDVQNVYLSNSSNPPIYTNLDPSGRVMDDPTDPLHKQQLRQLDYYSGTILPTIGVMVKF